MQTTNNNDNNNTNNNDEDTKIVENSEEKNKPNGNDTNNDTNINGSNNNDSNDSNDDNLYLPREYIDVNKGFELDINNITLESESTNNWKVYQRIGRGKYSEVFEGKHTKTNEIACVKILRPTLPKLLKLEIYVLQLLKNGPNIIQLLNTLHDERSNLWCLVFELLHCKELEKLIKVLTKNDIKYYMYEILIAINYAHSKGILHRDIKPANILIDNKNKKVRLIDWGLAAFYYPNQSYTVRVCTPSFKAPELLLEHKKYHYAVDIWAFGCMFAALIFQKKYMFQASNFGELLKKITQCLGTQKLNEMIKKYKINPPDFVNKFDTYQKKDWKEFISDKPGKDKFVDDVAIDLISKLLVLSIIIILYNIYQIIYIINIKQI